MKNSQFPSKATVDWLREQFPAGMRVELISMDDMHSELRPGDRGAVSSVDDTGAIFVNWDKGSHLGLIYGVDQFISEKDTHHYETGADFFRDIAVSYGVDATLEICSRYLGAQMGIEHSADEALFCREIFAEMLIAASKKTDPTKLIYPYDLKTADDRGEASVYRTSQNCNVDCARAIDGVINDSWYKDNQYNFDIAVMKTVNEYGFNRVNSVLAYNYQHRSYDGRLSSDNQKWLQNFHPQDEAFMDTILDAQPTLIDSFTDHARKLYNKLDARRFILPGCPASDEFVHGYEIVRAVAYDSQLGFAIGYNPDDPDADLQYVSLQFTTKDGKRDYYRDSYFNDFTGAAESYVARVLVYMSENNVRETPNPFTAVEMSTEQNYDMIDGLRNNMAPSESEPAGGQNNEDISGPTPKAYAEAAAHNETARNFADWLAVTESSRFAWIEDDFYRLNGQGLMYYTGREDGIYIRIDKDGALEAGNYKEAVFDIGEAVFKPVVTKQFPSYSDAFTALTEVGGRQFLIDLFSTTEIQPLAGVTGSNTPIKKTSVMGEIRQAQTTPTPYKERDHQNHKLKKEGLEL